ncbi:Lsr2 family protein [Micromonospora sp. NPDC049559]|uniref:histone-like nucleoid-structuring protein Lsr2 n=1 Tax=Micromonospora sp. NPDC049559 TaxID=3155923 RepID=UPI00341CDCE8
MARRTIVETIDDLTGEKNAVEVRFGIDGSEWTIDLAEASRAALFKALEPYLAVAKRTPTAVVRPRQQVAPTRGGRERSNRDQLRAVRDWWVANWENAGLREPSQNTVDGRGRIPAQVEEAYRLHGGKKVGRPVPGAVFAAAP